MTEQRYQAKIIKTLEARGWYVIKLTTTNKKGIADLLALKQGCPPLFIEVKAEKGKPSALQLFRLNEQRDRGFNAHLTRYGDDFMQVIEENY